MEYLYFLSTALAVCVFGLFATVYHYQKVLFDLNARLKEKDEKLKARKPETQSQELSDFLADFKSHGFSFTRVDPDSVFVRSPREH